MKDLVRVTRKLVLKENDMGFVGKNMVHSIEYEKSKKDRQLLKIEVSVPPRNSVLVIMKNPSTTCDNKKLPRGHYKITKKTEKVTCHIDRTTGRVLRKLKNYGYDEITIINLYSLYVSNPSNVNTYYYSGKTPRIFNENNLRIDNILKSFRGEVICAWGSPNGIRKPEYDKQIDYIYTLFTNGHNLLEYDPICKSKPFISKQKTYPPHGLTWK